MQTVFQHAPSNIRNMTVSKYRTDIELFRIIAALGIVWYHSGVIGREVAYSGLIFFLITSISLSGRRGKSVQERAQRIMVPWIFWFAVYALFRVLTHKPILDTQNGLFAAILCGPSIHLWYLPFIFFALVAADVVKKIIPDKGIAYGGFTLAILMFIAAFAWRKTSLSWGYPWAQYAHAAPGVFAGLFYMNISCISSRRRGLMIAVLLAAAASAIYYPGVGLPYLIGMAAYAVLTLWPVDRRFSFDLLAISKCMFGVYLVHPFPLMIANKFKLLSGVMLPIVAFLASTALIYAAHRVAPKWAKWVT